MAQYIFGCIAGDGRKRRVDEHYFLVDISDRDAVMAVPKHLGCQTLLRFEGLALDGAAHEVAHPFYQRGIMDIERTFAAAERVEHTNHLV